MPETQYSARRARLSVLKLFTSGIRRGLVSRDSVVDGDWLFATEWCQRYLRCCQPASDVADNFVGFCTEWTGLGKFLWIDSSGKSGNKKSRRGYFGKEFPAICNHYRVMAAWSPKTLKNFENFLRLVLEEGPLTVQFSKFCYERFHHDTDRHVVFKFREIWPTGNRWNRALLSWQKNNFARLSSCRYCADRAQNLPGPVPGNVLRVLQI